MSRQPRAIDIAETAVALDTVAARLDDRISPDEAAKLLRPVFSPHQGLLVTLSNLAGSAARYANHHTDLSPPERSLALNLGILAQELRDWSQVLHTTADDIAKLAVPSPGPPLTPGLHSASTGRPSQTTSVSQRRRR
ncbi:hypothetical protein ACWCXK_05930 [Streptomyces sp. NPDC001739]